MRIPDNVGIITRKSDASCKRTSPPQEGLTSRKRQASPPGSPERPTYARTFTGDTDCNPQPQQDIKEIPRDTWVPNPLPLDPPEIVVLPRLIVLSITNCKRQRPVRKLQGAVQTPMQLARYDRRYHNIYTIVRHRSMCPPYSLPHPVRPLQNL